MNELAASHVAEPRVFDGAFAVAETAFVPFDAVKFAVAAFAVAAFAVVTNAVVMCAVVAAMVVLFP